MRWAEQAWQRGRARHQTYLVQSEREGKKNNRQETDWGPVICSVLLCKQTDEGEAGHQVVWDRQPQSSAPRQLSPFEAVAPEGETSPHHSFAAPSFSVCSEDEAHGLSGEAGPRTAGEEKADIRSKLGGAQLESLWRLSVPSTIG